MFAYIKRGEPADAQLHPRVTVTIRAKETRYFNAMPLLRFLIFNFKNMKSFRDRNEIVNPAKNFFFFWDSRRTCE